MRTHFLPRILLALLLIGQGRLPVPVVALGGAAHAHACCCGKSCCAGGHGARAMCCSSRHAVSDGLCALSEAGCSHHAPATANAPLDPFLPGRAVTLAPAPRAVARALASAPPHAASDAEPASPPPRA